MAKIERIESQVTPGSGTFRAGPTGEELVAGATGQLAEAITQTAKVAQAFQQAKALNQVTKGRTELARGMNAIKNESETDDPVEAEANASKKVAKLRSQIMSTISNSQAQIDFGGTFDLTAESGLQSIRSSSRKRQVTSAQVDLNESIDTLAQDWVVEQDEDKRKIILGEIESSINEHVAIGVVDAKAGKSRLETLKKELPILDAKNAININAEEAKKMIESNEFGIADPADRSSLLTLANNMIKAKDFEVKKQKVENRFSTIDKIAQGDINYLNSDEFISEIAVNDPELAEAMSSTFDKSVGYLDSQGSYIPEKPANEAFQEIVNGVFQSRSQEEVSKFLVNALKDNQNISRDRLAIIVNAAKLKSGSMPLEGKGGLKKAIDIGYKIIIDNLLPFNATKAITNFITKLSERDMQDDEIIEEANKEVSKQLKVVNPQISKALEAGTPMLDKNGRAAIVFPTGQFKEITKEEYNNLIGKKEKK